MLRFQRDFEFKPRCRKSFVDNERQTDLAKVLRCKERFGWSVPCVDNERRFLVSQRRESRF